MSNTSGPLRVQRTIDKKRNARRWLQIEQGKAHEWVQMTIKLMRKIDGNKIHNKHSIV